MKLLRTIRFKPMIFTQLYFRLRRIKRICAGGEDHDGPFVCLKDIIGDRYYLCFKCFYEMLDEEREMDGWLDKQKEGLCSTCKYWENENEACWHDTCQGYPDFEGWEATL